MDVRQLVEPGSDAGAAIGNGIHEHRRFSLRSVTLSGAAVGGATIDTWRDGGRTARWAARLEMPISLGLREGVLEGTAADGRHLRGEFRLADVSAGLRRGKQILVALHGTGPLAEMRQAPEPPAAAPPSHSDPKVP